MLFMKKIYLATTVLVTVTFFFLAANFQGDAFHVLSNNLNEKWSTVSGDGDTPSRRILSLDEEIKYKSFVYQPPIVGVEDETQENLPEIYLQDKIKKDFKFNNSCAKFPDLFGLQFASDIWQVQKTAGNGGDMYLFNAYWDQREFNRKRPEIRVIVSYNRLPEDMVFFCQFWYEKGRPEIVKASGVNLIWVKSWGGNRDGFFNPYMVTCDVPWDDRNGTRVPSSVSLVTGDPCTNPTNNLAISNFYQSQIANPEEKKNFMVCVKGLNFPTSDQTLRIIEWIELLKSLGADKIHFYKFHIHPNAEKLLKYYVDEDFVETTQLTLAGGYPNNPNLQNLFLHKKMLERRLQEVIPYNDCLYKHMYDYKYVVLLDTDEVIVPVEGTWRTMLDKTVNPNDTKTSYMARNIYFLDNQNHNHSFFQDVPEFLHMMQHVYRSPNYTKPGAYVKGFHDTGKVILLHNHFPFKCSGGCSSRQFDLNLAHLQHYRNGCVKDVKNCEDLTKGSVFDSRVWNFKGEVIDRVWSVLRHLGFLQKSP